MNSTTSLIPKEVDLRYELSADQTAPADQLEPDFALVQLDTTFVTLVSEISALGSQHGDDREPRDAASVCSGEADITQKIEAILTRLAPVERAIMATSARTIVGLGIKARHAAYVVSEHWDVPIDQVEWDARAVRLLIEAVCEVAGVRFPFSNDGHGAFFNGLRTPTS